MRKWLILLILVVTPALSDVTMYKWTDDNGVVHYSDTPQANSEKVVIRSAQGYEASPVYTGGATAGGANAGSSSAGGNTYNYIRINAPTQEQVLWNVGGTVEVTLSVSPPLDAGHSIGLFYDSTNVASPGSQRLNFILNDVTRGQHSLRAAVLDGSGTEVIESNVTFFQVHQTSIQ